MIRRWLRAVLFQEESDYEIRNRSLTELTASMQKQHDKTFAQLKVAKELCVWLLVHCGPPDVPPQQSKLTTAHFELLKELGALASQEKDRATPPLYPVMTDSRTPGDYTPVTALEVSSSPSPMKFERKWDEGHPRKEKKRKGKRRKENKR